MLISSNSLTEETKSKLFNQNSSLLIQQPVPINEKSTHNSLSKPPQNRYETIFIKLFAQTTLQLIFSFSLIFWALIIIRDIIGLRINVLKFSFWFQFFINLGLLVCLIFAKMKSLSSVRTNSLTNPFEFYCNRDQLILIGVWTAVAFNFGAWYLRQYAPHLYKLFDHIKGKQYHGDLVLREQFFLIFITLLAQGFVSWIGSMFFSQPISIKPNPKISKTNLFTFLKSHLQDVTFWPNLLNRSGLIYVSLLSVNFLFAWLAFPLFGMLFSGLITINQPIRHSWFGIFKIGIFVHTFTLSLISNFIYSIIDWLIEFYLGRTFHTSSLVSDSERCLVVGLCHTNQNFIHLQACAEFLEISTDTNDFRRFKIFTAVEDEGSLSREICDWFCTEMKTIEDRGKLALQELDSFASILGGNNFNAELLPKPEVFKQYREKTIGLVELVLKRIFSSEKKENETNIISTTTTITGNPPLPEIFARRGTISTNASLLESSKEKKIESVPLMFEFGPFLQKISPGRLLISYWIASRKVYCIDQSEMLEIAIKAMGSFICASFTEDESGQVQTSLPRVLESMTKALTTIQSLLNFNLSLSTSSEILEIELRANNQIEIVAESIREALMKISSTFGETLEDVRISSQCLELIKSLSI